MLNYLRKLKRAKELVDKGGDLFIVNRNVVTPDELKALQANGDIVPLSTHIEPLGDGNAVFLPYMDEDEMLKHIKEEEMGWGKVYKQVSNIIKGKE